MACRRTNVSAGLKIAQLNARRSRKVTPEIRQAAVESGIDILLLQEPYTRSQRIEGFGIGTRIVKCDNVVPWAAIAILNSVITALKLTHLCTSHFAIAEVDCAGSSLYIASGYFQLSHPIEDHLNNLANRPQSSNHASKSHRKYW